MRKILNSFFLSGFLLACSLFNGSLAFASEDIEYRFERMWPRLEQPWYFSSPSDIAIASDGSVYIVDSANNRIQQFSAQGDLINKWGSVGSGEGQFDFPEGIAIASDSSVYIVDTRNHRIQQFSAQGDFIRKWGTEGTGDGQFYYPNDIALAPDGSVYIVGSDSNRIQQFSAQGNFIRKWGTKGSGEGQFDSPQGIAIAADGSVYVAEWNNHRIQQFSAQGDFIRAWGENGSGAGQFDSPVGIEIAPDGSIYVAEINGHRIQQFSAQGTFILELWGNGMTDSPKGIAIASDDSFYVVNSEGVVHISTLGVEIERWESGGSGEGQFHNPAGMTIAPDGSVYVADQFNNRIQQFSAQGDFIRMWGKDGSKDGEFVGPSDIAIAADGSVYITDLYNDRIQQFSAVGNFIRKWGSEGTGDGEFIRPQGIAISPNGDVYVIESGNRRIQQFSAQGEFIRKWKVLVDFWNFSLLDITITLDGSVFVAVPGKQRIEQYSAEGALIRKWQYQYSGTEQLLSPAGIAIDLDGSVFMTDRTLDSTQLFTAQGDFIQTLGNSGSGDGQFSYPQGIAIASDGSVYVVDSGNNRIQKFAPKIKSTTSHPYKGIILAGGGKTIAGRANHIWNGTKRVTQKAYKALTRQAFKQHEEIKFLTAGSTQVDLDNNNKFDDLEVASKKSLRLAITEWATDATDVVIFLANHGGPGKFQVNDKEILTGNELNSWVTQLEKQIPGKVTVIIEACNSAAFFKQLSKQGRYLFASAKADQPAVISNDGLTSFSYYLWSEVATGARLEPAFKTARQGMSKTIIDGQAQDAQAETDGNQVFNNLDLENLSHYCLGNCNQTAAVAPNISPVSPSLRTLKGEMAQDFTITVNHLQRLNRAWALVQRPDDISIDPNQPLNFEKINLQCNKQDICQGRYERFDLKGEYRISFYAMDDNEDVSFPETLIINQTEGKPVIPAQYNESLATVYLRDVVVNGQHLQAALELKGGKFVVIAFSDASKQFSPAAQFDFDSGILEIPHAQALGQDYQAKFKYLGNLEFELLSAEPK